MIIRTYAQHRKYTNKIKISVLQKKNYEGFIESNY